MYPFYPVIVQFLFVAINLSDADNPPACAPQLPVIVIAAEVVDDLLTKLLNISTKESLDN